MPSEALSASRASPTPVQGSPGSVALRPRWGILGIGRAPTLPHLRSSPRAHQGPSASGVDEIIGLVGKSASALDPKGKVFVRGEYWNVEVVDPSAGPIEEGEAVQVVDVEGLTLRVRRAGSS